MQESRLACFAFSLHLFVAQDATDGVLGLAHQAVACSLCKHRMCSEVRKISCFGQALSKQRNSRRGNEADTHEGQMHTSIALGLCSVVLGVALRALGSTVCTTE